MAESRQAGQGLERNAVGLREVLFQSVTAMAPAGAVAFSIPAGASFAAGALPLATLFALIACMFVAVSIGQLARHLPSAGSFYTYTSKGVHPWLGFLVAWTYSFAEPFMVSLCFLLLGIVTAGFLNTEFGWSTGLWWVWVLVGIAIITYLGYRGVQVSTKTGTWLGVFEILVFGALAVWLIIDAGSRNSLSVFGTHNATVSGSMGFSGVIAASVYSVLAFTGFESAAPLAEEARDPRRTISKAVIYSALAIGGFYVFTTYAATVWIGPAKMAGFAALNDNNPWTHMAKAVWGVGWLLVVFAIINSEIANSNAASNVTTRTWFAMGRIRLLPAALGTVHPKFKSPHVAVLVQAVIALVLALWLGFQYSPYTAFLLMATIFTIILILIYIAVLIACITYYWRFQRQEANIILHGLIPGIGIVVFVPVFLTAAGIPVFSFVAKLSYPISLAGPVVGIWILIGIGYMAYLHARHPERLTATAQVFADEPAGNETVGGAVPVPAEA
jgi:amino acid transporter